MIPIRRLLGLNDRENTNNNNTDQQEQLDDDENIIFINDDGGDDQDEDMIIDDEHEENEGELVYSSSNNFTPFVMRLNESVPSIIKDEDLVSDFFRFRLGSLALFQKKTAQLGFPLRLVLQQQENPTRMELTSENLPSYLLQEYLFDQENYKFVSNEMEVYAQSLMETTGEKLTLLSPMIHLIRDVSRIKFAWKSATSLEYKHAKFEKNQQENKDKTITCPESQTHEYLENLPSVFQIQKLAGATPISYYYNERIVIQLHPFLCLQVKPSELRQSRHYNISQSKTSKYRGYYFYFEITILDSKFTSRYGDEAVTEVGVGLAKYKYEEGMTGWYQNSIGYHSDCGRIYDNEAESTDKSYAGKAKIGDTIGVSWSLDTGDVTFTKNGIVCRTATGVSCWKKDFWSKEFSTFCPTISSDYEQQVFYVNVGLNRAIYPFRYYQFNTYEEQEIMFSHAENRNFVDVKIATRE